MHQAAAAWHCFWGRPRSFALLWLRLPCCLISVPFAVAMPTRLALPHQRAAALWSTQGMRHAACGTPTAHNSLQLPKDAQWKWSGRRWRSWSRYSKFTLQLKFRFDAAILLAHLAHALRGRAQRVEGGGGRGAALLCGAIARMTSTIYSSSWTFAARQQESEDSLAFSSFFWHTNRPLRPASAAHPPGLPLSLGSLVANGFAALLFCHRNLRVSRI